MPTPGIETFHTQWDDDDKPIVDTSDRDRDTFRIHVASDEDSDCVSICTLWAKALGLTDMIKSDEVKPIMDPDYEDEIVGCKSEMIEFEIDFLRVMK